MQDDARERVAANVRAEIGRAGKTASDAARELGMSKQALSPRLRGQRAFRAEEIAAIADWLGVSTTVLLASDRQGVAA